MTNNLIGIASQNASLAKKRSKITIKQRDQTDANLNKVLETLLSTKPETPAVPEKKMKLAEDDPVLLEWLIYGREFVRRLSQLPARTSRKLRLEMEIMIHTAFEELEDNT